MEIESNLKEVRIDYVTDTTFYVRHHSIDIMKLSGAVLGSLMAIVVAGLGYVSCIGAGCAIQPASQYRINMPERARQEVGCDISYDWEPFKMRCDDMVFDPHSQQPTESTPNIANSLNREVRSTKTYVIDHDDQPYGFQTEWINGSPRTVVMDPPGDTPDVAMQFDEEGGLERVALREDGVYRTLANR